MSTEKEQKLERELATLKVQTEAAKEWLRLALTCELWGAVKDAYTALNDGQVPPVQRWRERSGSNDGQLRADLMRLSLPDFTHKCEACGATPVMPLTGMCGPCTTGEASTAGGKW